MEEEQQISLLDLKQKMAAFAKERDWDQFHSPRNLLLALDWGGELEAVEQRKEMMILNLSKVGEVGELSEIFQWKGEVSKGLIGWGDEEKEHVGEELSDVLLYLIRLSDICGIDLGKAVLRKMELNAIKYPPIPMIHHLSKRLKKQQHPNVCTTTSAIDPTPTIIINNDNGTNNGVAQDKMVPI